MRRPEDFTLREKQNRAIASQLKLSLKTVEDERVIMMKKVRVRNTAQLLKAAIRDDLIKLS